MEIYTKCKEFLLSPFLGKSSDGKKASQSSGDYVKLEEHASENDEGAELKADLFELTRSIDEIFDDIGLRLFHLKVFLILGLLTATVGFEISMVSIIIPSIKEEWDISSVVAGILTSSLSLGFDIGCWFWGWVYDKYGRKRGFIAGGISMLVFGFASAFSPNYYWLWVTLFLVGFSLACSIEVFVMTMELFPPKYRVMFSVLSSVSFSVGFLLSGVTSIKLWEIGYHWALAVVCFPVLIFLIILNFLPDTPHYHLAAGDEQKALNILQDFAPEMDFSSTRLKREPESNRADITQLFRSGYWRVTICACVVAFSVVIVFYVLIFTASDISSSHNQTTFENLVKSNKQSSSDNALHSAMAWMNLPAFAMMFTVAVGCYFFPVKDVLRALLISAILLQFVGFFVLNHRAALLIVTILCRSLLLATISVMIIYISLLYPTANRSLGVGFCVSVGHIGMVLGPFIFEAFFTPRYLYGIVFNIGILFLGLIATVLLPSRSSAID